MATHTTKIKAAQLAVEIIKGLAVSRSVTPKAAVKAVVDIATAIEKYLEGK